MRTPTSSEPRHFSYTCSAYWCQRRRNVRFAPGFSGRAGVLLELNPRFSIDLAVKLAMTFPGNMFDSAESYITPVLGGLFTL